MTIKIHIPELLDIDLIDIDPNNTNKQDRQTFKTLQENIVNHGIDENCIVIPKGDRYLLVHGNHRYAAAKAAGAKQVLAVIRTDWDEVTAATQSVFRNNVRGELDSKAFTELVNSLHEEHNLNFDEIQASMGFHDSDEFASLYKEEKEQEERIERVENEDLPKIRALDDLLTMVSHLIEEYGNTLESGFMIVPLKNKDHLYIPSSNALKNIIIKICEICINKGMDLSTALTGLLHLGCKSSHFGMEFNKIKELEEIEKMLTTNENDNDFNELKCKLKSGK